jgi:hypothetical protein
MQFKVPKNNEKYEWTQHSIIKMKSYGLTAQRILRVINNPQRKEEGVVEKTIAVMQPTSVSTKDGKRVWTSEIWAMYQLGRTRAELRIPKNIQHSAFSVRNSANRKIRIISAWRYPGVSPKNNPVPEDVIRELESAAEDGQ